MRKIYFLLPVILLLVNQTTYSQLDFDINKYIENPKVVGENKEPGTTILIPYQNTGLALSREINDSKYYSSLNGKWKFKFQMNPSQVPAKFYSAGFDDKVWDNITVPSVWQMQGFDHLMYRNIPMEFQPYNAPYVPDDINPTGLYRRAIEIPKDWEGRRIFLHFDGIQSCAFVWLNGKYVGYHEDGMTPAEFDITDKVEKDGNQLSVMVLRWCDGSYLEDQDMFRYSGIYRNAYIYSKPAVTLRDLFIKTDFDNTYTNANLILDLTLKNYSQTISKNKIRYTLYDGTKRPVLIDSSDVIDIQGQIKKTITKNVSSPHKWSDEKPYLYTLVLELMDGNGNSIEILSQRVGFRKLEVKNGIALLNGKPVYFRGTNRHEHNPDNGKTLTKEWMLEDIKLLKQFNFNAVRTCHYPNDPLWYDLCDEYGILLQDEVNAECHNAEDTFADREDYVDSFVDRFVRMVERDKNHPSVVMWSTGNEAGLGKPHFMMADYIKKFDTTRFLMHQSNRPDGEAPYVDILGPRYPTPYKLRMIGLNAVKPVVMGEYDHAMGNSLGHFDEFWETIYEIPKLQGGFVWDWVDQGLNVKARFVKDYSQNDIQCSVMGTPEIVNGINDKAFKLSGLDDWIEMYDDKRLDITGNNLTIEAVIFPQKFYGENNLVAKAFQYGITQTATDTLNFYINDYSNSLNVKLPDNWYTDWHKVKAVYDGKNMLLDIDGKIYGTKPCSENIATTHYPLNIGRDFYKNNEQYLGWISDYIYDEVKIFDRANTESAGSTPILWLKFDKITDGKNYFTFGISPFCINGMVTADRKAQPELWQAKHSMSPVRFYSENLVGGNFKAVNKYSFTNLNEFETDWCLYKDGAIIKSGKVELDVEPQSRKEFKLPVPKNLDNGHDYVFEISSKLKNDEPFRSKGFEVNFQQFVLNEKKQQVSQTGYGKQTKIKANQGKDVYTFASNGLEYKIDKTTGALSLYNKGKLAFSSLNSNIWRAPISNEKFDWGKAEAEDWYRMGLNDYSDKVDKIECSSNMDSTTIMMKIKSYTTFPRSNDMYINQFEYTFSNNGSVKINHTMTPFGNFEVSWLPCIGLSLRVPNEYQDIKWYGRGPYENYSDRNTGQRIGIHSAKIDSVQNPYIEPQEYGNYSEVNWFEIKDSTGAGIKVTSDKAINFLAVPYYNLDRARYMYQLLNDGFSRVNISYAATGVGETPNPALPQYRVYPQIYSNTILITYEGK